MFLEKFKVLLIFQSLGRCDTFRIWTNDENLFNSHFIHT